MKKLFSHRFHTHSALFAAVGGCLCLCCVACLIVLWLTGKEPLTRADFRRDVGVVLFSLDLVAFFSLLTDCVATESDVTSLQ